MNREAMPVINKIRAYFHFLFDLANVNRNEWQVAIRKRGEQTLYQGNTAGFRPIKNSLRYWYADPFLFSHRDKDYLFVEMFDRWREKGVLGVCRLRNGKHSRFRICLDLPGHLSYPCVYEDADGIHMVPECYQSGEVWVYRCVDFPLRWEKERQLLKGCAVDTTPCPVQKGLWLTTVFDSPNARINNNLWQVDDRSGQLICLSKENFQVRGAGHFIPTEEVEDYSYMVNELLSLYTQALERYPLLLEQLQLHRKTGEPLGSDFAPDFG